MAKERVLQEKVRVALRRVGYRGDSESTNWIRVMSGYGMSPGRGAESPCPSIRAADGRRHRRSDGNPRSRRGRHRGACRRLTVRTSKMKRPKRAGNAPAEPMAV